MGVRVLASASFMVAMSLCAIEARAGSDWQEHPNHVALFGGVTADSDHTLFTLGADYERRLSNVFGAGALADFAVQDPKHQIYAGVLFLHAAGDLKFVLAPGIERTSAHDLEESHTTFFFRVGAAYDFHVGALSISPTVNLDMTSGHAAGVFGLSFGMGF